jgi:hypothetical protein
MECLRRILIVDSSQSKRVICDLFYIYEQRTESRFNFTRKKIDPAELKGANRAT